MKKLILLLLILVPSLGVRADDSDNWLQNGDFSDGIDHWYGDGHAPADFAPSNPLDTPDPFTSKGLIIPLARSHWKKVAQDFKGKLSKVVVTITYMVSPDLTFSTRPDDYVNMPGQISYNGWAPFTTATGSWVLLVSDFGSSTVIYTTIKPDLGSSKVQTIRDGFEGLTPKEDKTITLAFPPGTGTIVILGISMTNG